MYNTINERKMSVSFEGIIMGIIFIILTLCDCGIIPSFILSIILGMIVCFIIVAIYDAARPKEEREKEKAEARRVEAEMRRIDNEIDQSIALIQAGLIPNSSQNKCKLCGQPVPDGIEICYVCMRHMR